MTLFYVGLACAFGGVFFGAAVMAFISGAVTREDEDIDPFNNETVKSSEEDRCNSKS